MFISGLEQEIANAQKEPASRLKFWEFGVGLVQRMEAERFSQPEEEFNSAYEAIILLLLTLGLGLKQDIKDPEVIEHIKANMDNLNSKYITFKLPPLEKNRLLDLIAA